MPRITDLFPCISYFSERKGPKRLGTKSASVMPPTHSLNFVRHAFRQQIWPSIIIDNTCFTLQVPARSKILHRDAFSEVRVILTELVYIIAWFVVIFAINTTSDISKLLYVISRADRRVEFETILKYHECYLCQI